MNNVKKKDLKGKFSQLEKVSVDPENMDPGMKALLRQVRDNLEVFTDGVLAACKTVEIAAAKRPIVDVSGCEDITDLKVLGAEMRLAFDQGNYDRLSALIDMLRRSVNP